MAIALGRAAPAVAPEPDVFTRASSPWWAVAVIASIGAGAIHAAAAGAHAEHPQAVRAFTAVAAVQIGWAVWATRSSRSVVRWIGAVLALGAVVGWVTAKTIGISFVQGLQSPEPVQTADAVAAALAVTAAVMIGLASLPRLRSMHDQSRPPALVASAAVAVLAVVAVNGIDSHDHGTHVTAAAGHAHAAPMAAHPYDPTKPIDLGGVPGVTPQQQAAAESLVVITLARLPHWADASVAEAAGFRSIGDGFTGVEHFVNQTFMTDDVILDPDRPESLVYDTKSGGRRLVAPCTWTSRARR